MFIDQPFALFTRRHFAEPSRHVKLKSDTFIINQNAANPGPVVNNTTSEQVKADTTLAHICVICVLGNIGKGIYQNGLQDDGPHPPCALARVPLDRWRVIECYVDFTAKRCSVQKTVRLCTLHNPAVRNSSGYTSQIPIQCLVSSSSWKTCPLVIFISLT